jgi:ABC-2 type transport system ATP-binding protein
LNPLLTLGETLTLFSSFYDRPRPIDEVIDLAGLQGREDARMGTLSGGQQRRADVAIALIGDPDLIFLDEPTTGFDPTARREAWQTIAGLKDIGKTIVLTTHYMEEAQHLSDRVAIIRSGEIVAEGRPQELVAGETIRTVISFVAPSGIEVATVVAEVSAPTRREGSRIEVETDDAQRTLFRLMTWAERDGVELDEIEVRRPTLEDVFLELTRAGTTDDA